MIEVDSQDKIRIAKSGANKLFEVDYDVRQNMSDQQLIELFDQVWQRGLERRVLKAEVIPSDEVNRRLLDKYHNFVDFDQQHRSFRYAKAEFIVQLQPSENAQCKLTQLWRVVSSDSHPKTLFITFSSVEERQRFTSLAQSLGINDDEDLGLRLIRNFMDLHPGDSHTDDDDLG